MCGYKNAKLYSQTVIKLLCKFKSNISSLKPLNLSQQMNKKKGVCTFFLQTLGIFIFVVFDSCFRKFDLKVDQIASDKPNFDPHTY